MFRSRLLWAGLFALVAVAAAPAVVVYDAPAGFFRPDSAAWLWHYGANSASGAAATVTGPSAASPYTALDTTANADLSAGWGRLSPIALDRTVGYVAAWQSQLVSSGLGNNRAGFSVIVLSNDRRGVEFGMGSGRIFAYQDDLDFTPGEGVDLDLTARRSFHLSVSGNGYQLAIDGVNRLSGGLRLYDQTRAPYNVGNFLFVGDDTTRQASESRFRSFSVTAVPEPSVLAGVGLALVAALRRKRRA